MRGPRQRRHHPENTNSFSRRRIVLNVEHLEDRRLLSGGPFVGSLPNVTYHGGPLLNNVQIQSVFDGAAWSTNASLQQMITQVDGFLQYFPTSPYMDVLKQYNVGHGAFQNDVVLPQNPPGGQTIDDSQIRQLLDTAIAGHQLAAPTANQLYIFFTAPGTTVTAHGQSSANDFAGYHDAFTDSAGAAVYYAVVPYPTGGVANVPLSDLQQTTVILSHEIAEAVTDPDTQTGWFDARQGEIGDIAAGTTGTLHGYVMQGVWSQADGRVIIPTDTTGTSLQVTGTPVQATAGQSFTTVVATITGAPAGTKPSSYTATIDWGDGTTSAGTITVDPNGGFDVSGTNTYAHAGSFAITVTVRDQTSAVVGTALTSASVAPTVQTLRAQGTKLTATAGQQFTATVATFTDATPGATASQFTVTIDWGDGTNSAGSVSAGPGGEFTVTGTHTYEAGSSGAPGGWGSWPGPGDQFFVVTVSITDTSTNAAATARSLALVAPAPPNITAKGQNIQAVSGQSFTGVVATFTDVIPGAARGDFTATIDWGDGTTSTGTITADPSGGFDVNGTHTYSTSNDWFGFGGGFGLPFGPGGRHFLVHVTITDAKTDDQATSRSLATVAPAPPNIAVTAQNIQATQSQSFTGIVATFTDVNAGALPSGFTATINWGDGTVSAGTITADPKGGFDVTGTHTYANLDAPFSMGGLPFGWGGGGGGISPDIEHVPFTVTVKSTTTTDVGFAVGVATVTPPPATVQPSGTTINAVFGQAFTGTVATFTTTDANPKAANFTATIDWGDGTISAGTVAVDPNGGFDITGTHTYTGAFPGWGWGNPQPLPGPWNPIGSGGRTFLVSLTISDTTTNTTASALSLASVTATPSKIAATGQNLHLTAGTAFTGTVATFADADPLGATSFRATIVWGDGSFSTGSVTASGGGGFVVIGTNTYQHGGTYPVLVKIMDADNNNAVSLGTATVTDTSMPTTLPQVGTAFLQSAEYLSDLVTNDYEQYLGRTPGAAEVGGWVSALQHGMTSNQVLAGFLSSPEFYNHAGSDRAWVDALYNDLLGRNADTPGESNFLRALGTGMTKNDIVLAFANSSERESLVVQGYYQQYLGRTAATPEVAGWVNAFEHGLTNQQITASFIGSPEYYQAHNANANDWLSSVYQTLLSRTPDQAGQDGWLNVLQQGMP
jgi:hypothetical protein